MNAEQPGRTPFLPNFCRSANLLRTMLFAQLLAFILVAVQPGTLAERTTNLALVTLFIQWVAIVDVALLCLLRRQLARVDDRLAALIAFALLQAVPLLLTVAVAALPGAFGLPPLSERALAPMALENAVISAIVTALALRYFYVSAEWQRNVRAEAQARVQALQARIRPHFLFNSMNTIASLTRSDAVAAERAVEDLAELFRATLAQRPMLTLAEELEFVASYLRIESLRLGSRLAVDWDLDPAAGEAHLPALSLQPLVENAVYHGIEARPEGGTIHISSKSEGQRARLRVDNPLPTGPRREGGHHLAQDNVRQRLELAWGEAARFETREEADRYVVILEVPLASR